MTLVLKSKWLLIAVGFCCFSLLVAAPQFCSAKTLAKVALSGEGTSTGLPDLFSGTMSYSIPIEVPAGRKGMDPGLALNYRSGSGNGVLGVGWELELGSIQRATTGGIVDFSGDSYLLTKTGSASSLFSVGTNSYQTKIEGGFSRIQQISTANGPYWVVTDKAGMRFYYGQSAASRQDDSGSISRIFKWNLDRVEDTNGNYIAIYYYKDQNQIYLDRIEYTGNAGLEPTNSVYFYWESRTDLNPASTSGFTVTTGYRLSSIESRIRTYELAYSYSSLTNGSLLYSVTPYDFVAKTPTCASTGINSSRKGICCPVGAKCMYKPVVGQSLPATTMSYEQRATYPGADYLTYISNGIGGTTTVAYLTQTLTGTTDTVSNVSSVSVNDGNGKVSTTYYQYTGGYYYAPESDFRGFNKVEVWGPVSDDGKQVRTETYFHQGSDTAVDANNPAVPTGFTKGRPYRSITYAVSGVTTGNEATVTRSKTLETTTIYAPKSISAPFYTPPMQIDSYLYDGDSSYKQSRTIFTYGDYGNVTQVEIQGDVNDSTNDRTIVRTFSPNTTSWIAGLPTAEDIYQGIGSSVKIAGKTFYYDDLTACDGSSTNNQTPVKGNLTRVVSWLDGGTNPEVRMAYDNYGNPVCRRDAKGNTTTFAYDSSKTFLVTATNPLQHQVLTQYYGVNELEVGGYGLYGQVKNVTDPNGAVTKKEYDSFGRPSKVTLPDNTWTNWTYNNFGTAGSQYVRMDASDGLWSESYFDGLGRTYLKKTKGPESKTIASSTVYDARGAVRKTSFPYSYGETPLYVLTDYDAIGRVVRSGQESPADYIRSLTCYNKDVTVKIDPNNHRRREVRDSSGRLIKVQEYTGAFSLCSTEEGTPYATTTYQYDVLGNLRFVTDANGNQTEMRYDTLGRKRYMNDPDMGAWSYTYDANGNLTTQTDAKWQVITFTYDGLNRLATKKHGASLVLANYYDQPTSSNSIGRLSSLSDPSGQAVYNYDTMGRTTSTTKIIAGTAYNLGFSFLNGRLDNITYPDNEKVYYSYDAGYLKGVTGYIGYSNFDALGRPKNATYGTGGASSLYSYYPDTQRLHTLSVASPGHGLLIDNSYGYDNKGNISSITDNLGKVLPTSISSETYTPTRAHAVGSTGSGRIFQYDANGNINNDGLRSITYDYDNMPTSIGNISFTYDGSATRVKKSSPGRTTDYIGKLYECTNGSCAKFIFAGDTRVAMKVGGQVSYYHPDHQGSTSVVTDVSGNKMEELAYYPFGGQRQGVGTASVSHTYTGQELDGETGLYNYNARIYDPDLGRFMTPDSIVPDPSNPQSLNRYSYVLNNPMNYTDPTGHWSRKKFWSGVEIVAGLGIAIAGSGSPYSYPAAIVGVAMIADGVIRYGGDVDIQTGPQVVATLDGPPASSNGGAGSGGSSGSGSNSSGGNSSTPIGIPIGNTGINYVGPGSGAWSGGNNYGYGSPQLSLGYEGFDGGGNPRSSSVISDMINGVKTGVTGGANATPVAIRGGVNATRDIATNGPPVAQATLGFAAYMQVGPFVGPLATTYVLTNPTAATDWAINQLSIPGGPSKLDAARYVWENINKIGW